MFMWHKHVSSAEIKVSNAQLTQDTDHKEMRHVHFKHSWCYFTITIFCRAFLYSHNNWVFYFLPFQTNIIWASPGWSHFLWKLYQPRVWPLSPLEFSHETEMVKSSACTSEHVYISLWNLEQSLINRFQNWQLRATHTVDSGGSAKTSGISKGFISGKTSDILNDVVCV